VWSWDIQLCSFLLINQDQEVKNHEITLTKSVFFMPVLSVAMITVFFDNSHGHVELYLTVLLLISKQPLNLNKRIRVIPGVSHEFKWKLLTIHVSITSSICFSV